MGLFSSLQIANNALRAAQIGLQVTGNNIANADTPGYIRQQAVLAPAPTQRYGGLLLGLGVDVQGIVQRTDSLLEERLRGASGDLANSQARQDIYTQLETLMGELGDSDLSTSLTKFFGSINDILNQPESVSVRNLAVLTGQTLASDINRLNDRVREIRSDVNDRIFAMEDRVNSLLKQISDLNVKIVGIEGGVSKSDAVGLRDQRTSTLGELAKLISIQTNEQPNGTVSVNSGGNYLVIGSVWREVESTGSVDRGLTIGELRIKEIDAPLDNSSGELGGLLTARDEILGGFLDRLDSLTRTVVYEFNKIHAGGQGLTGFSSVTSEFKVADTGAALDAAGLSYAPTNGSFQVLVRNKQTGLVQTRDITVDLNGLDDNDTSLADLAAALDGIDGISAAISPDRGLTITADSPLVEFAFANDTSGALASLGINTFFTGVSAGTMGVNAALKSDPSKLAASSRGIAEGTGNAEKLASLLTTKSAALGGDSLAVVYDKFVAQTVQGSSLTKAATEGFQAFQQTLESQSMAVSGVNIDEEAVRMIAYQRMFQASAKFISVLDELLNDLVNL